MTISYEDVPYEGSAVSQSHPERLAVDAWLRGFRPAHPARSRILELGCAEGANIVPLAYHYPNAEVIGVDSSARHIEQAEHAKYELGLDNLRLVHTSITDVASVLDGEFDYILCHGVLSWVSEKVQDAIFRTTRDFLAPHGIAYVSYNVVPGWKMRGLVREVLMARTRGIEGHAEKLAEARSVLTLLSTTSPHDMSYCRYMAEEAASTLEHSDAYIAHEYLCEHNRAFLYGEIVRLAGRFGLRFLSEHSPVGHPAIEERVRETVASITSDPLEREEISDVLHGRAFRASAFVREDAPTEDPEVAASELLDVAGVVTTLRPATQRPSLTAGETEEFVDSEGMRVAARDPVLKAALLVLAQCYPRAMRFADLEGSAVALLQGRRVFKLDRVLSADERRGLRHDVLRLARLGHLSLRLTQPAMVVDAGPRPRVRTLTRYEVRRSACITSVFHEPMHLDDASRYLVGLLDGSLEHDELVQALLATLAEHEVQIHDEAGQPLSGEGAAEAMRLFLARTLRALAVHGLLEH